MNKRIITCGALALTLMVGGFPAAYGQAKVGGGAATAAPEAGAKLSSSDQDFIKKAAIGNMAEVQLGELVREKGSAPEVKEFAALMVTDHGKAQQDLQAVATGKGVQLPTELDAKHKALAEKLGKLTGADLDKAYMEEMLKDHKKDVSEYEKASKSIKDPDLKGYVDKTLPTLQEHLKHAQQAAGDVKGGKGKAGEKASSEKKGA